jgi:nucleotide-binding universal stress UspA family protein
VPTIAVGLHGSNGSWRAFWWACGEAARLGARIIAVYVSRREPPMLTEAALAGLDPSQYVAAVYQANEERAARLRFEVEPIAADLCLDITLVHAEGDVAEQLAYIAAGAQADAIVVGRSAKFRHRLAGSVGRRLTRTVDSAIVVVVP